MHHVKQEFEEGNVHLSDHVKASPLSLMDIYIGKSTLYCGDNKGWKRFARQACLKIHFQPSPSSATITFNRAVYPSVCPVLQMYQQFLRDFNRVIPRSRGTPAPWY